MLTLQLRLSTNTKIDYFNSIFRSNTNFKSFSPFILVLFTEFIKTTSKILICSSSVRFTLFINENLFAFHQSTMIIYKQTPRLNLITIQVMKPDYFVNHRFLLKIRWWLRKMKFNRQSSDEFLRFKWYQSMIKKSWIMNRWSIWRRNNQNKRWSIRMRYKDKK